MGLSLDTYLDLTPFEFAAAYQRFIERVEKDRESSEINEWRRVRWLAWSIGNYDRNEVKTEFDILKLPYDEELQAARESKKEVAVVASSEDRYEALKNKWH